MTKQTVPCTLCGANDSRFVFHIAGIDIRDCVHCDHRFADYSVDANHLGRVYGDDYFFGGGAGYQDYLASGELLRYQGRCYGQRLASCIEPGRLLDVGAAAGFLMQGFRESGWQPEGIEPNRAMADHARNVFDLPTHVGTLEDYDAPRATFAAVAMVQVIGHVANLSESLARIHDLLLPGGLLLIETWLRDAWSARLLGPRWHEYSPPSVLHWFGRRDLKFAADRFGFQHVAKGRPVKWITAGHGKSLLRYKYGNGWLRPIVTLCDASLPDRLAIPYVMDDVAWVVWRKDCGNVVS
ncbi:MAG: methyltransferase domain-containing protein [Pirellulaceae bacterium]|nr:methyltransferase domain-containing protein [Planctomycetales bacterium]